MSGLMKIAFWVTVAGQIALLVAFIAVKENVLRTGTSVVLQTVPVDPRSLLQGDYAILDYEIAELPGAAANNRQGDTIYVELEGNDDIWWAYNYTQIKPEPGRVFIKGIVNSRGRLDFGIGTYFIPEGTGHIIERSRDLKVRVAVSSGGTAVIEELLVDGVPFDSSLSPIQPAVQPVREAPTGVPPPREPERKPQ